MEYQKRTEIIVNGVRYVDVNRLAKEINKAYPVSAAQLRKLARLDRIPHQQGLGMLNRDKYWFNANEVLKALTGNTKAEIQKLEVDEDEADLAGL